MSKKARRRRKILGFWANVIKPPPLVFGRSETRGGFTGIGLISSRPRLLNLEAFCRVVLSVTHTPLGTGIRSLKMPDRGSWTHSIPVTSVPRARGARWGLRGRQKWFVGEVGVLFVRNSQWFPVILDSQPTHRCCDHNHLPACGAHHALRAGF